MEDGKWRVDDGYPGYQATFSQWCSPWQQSTIIPSILRFHRPFSIFHPPSLPSSILQLTGGAMDGEK
jgi:hypothetical protein